jgi:hypothetical protein
MGDKYYADVYLRGCGELIKAETLVEDGESLVVKRPGMVKITVYAYKPEEDPEDA